MDKDIIELRLSDNAFGPNGVSSFEDFLENSKGLKILDVTNCGLGPEGAEMIAIALKKNKDMKLEELYSSRDRLEDKGMAAIAEVLAE